ncbi:nuclear transport factor 2 family protein [Sphingobium sp. WCS2017Hpa-17]|uniref:nuclear transport factor 2 family protein n=1 Tax=Sphingobium sp. WCS2017Hpa-17 TaxID=3073638 RepID=UPI00288A731A|nr:nuclear transport factor 2 family protein [Sphingobium sp. WCS2017Hpa-17]
MNILPDAGNAAVINSSIVEIQADVDHVWSVLTDFASYGDWNPLCRAITVDAQVGGLVRMDVKDDLKDAVITFDYRLDEFDVGQRIAWSAEFPDLGLTARRDQYLQPLDAERCVYWSTDLYTGPQARQQAELNGAWVRSAFDNMALALKARSEGAGVLGAADTLAIGQAIAFYSEAIDDRNLALLARCFASSAQITIVGQSFTLEQYRELCQVAERNLNATQHQLGPSRLWRDSRDSSHVRARTSFIATHVHPEDLEHPVVVGGTYHDCLAQEAEGWRIVERTGEVLWTTGDMALLDFSGAQRSE